MKSAKRQKPLRICYYGSYDLNEPHNSTYLRALNAVGVEVVECHIPAASKRDDISQYRSFGKTLAFAFGFVRRSLRLFFRLWRVGKVDAVIVGYPGFFDLPLAKIYTKLRRIPLLFNVHISLYETLVVDRSYFLEASLTAKLLKWYDRLLLRLSDVVIVDTRAHGSYYASVYKVPRGKFRRVFIGADPIFRPVPPPPSTGYFRVLFYGTFVPLQGIEFILQAAKHLEHELDVIFEIIGRGQTKAEMVALAKSYDLRNVDFIDWVPLEHLVERIAAADVCLGGQFGLSPKADLVIGYKCFQMMACRKPLIVSDSQGNRELLKHMVSAYMCKAGDGEALARAIMELKHSPTLREQLAQRSWAVFNTHCDFIEIGSTLRNLILQALGRPIPAPAARPQSTPVENQIPRI